jgi:hypothetical protein
MSDDLKLTNQELVAICNFADTASKNPASADIQTLAFALKAVSLCLHRLQAGEPEDVSGPKVDEWYDSVIGQNVRVMWTQVKPVAENLRQRGVI